MSGGTRSGADRLLTARQAAAFLGETVTRFMTSPIYESIPVTPRRTGPGSRAVLMYRLGELEAWLDANGPVTP